MLETPIWIQSGSFPSQADRLLIDTLTSDGVLDGRADPVVIVPASADLAATANATLLGLDMAPGVCVITGTDQTRQGKYVCRSTAVQTVQLDPRPAAGQTRLDLVYAKVIDTSAGITGTDGWIIDKVTGVPSGSAPTLPAVPSSALALAQARVTSAGGGTLLPADITDLRRRAYSRQGPIQKALKVSTLVATADDFFAFGGYRSIPGAQIPITTYLPNVPVVMSAGVNVSGVAANDSASVRFELLAGGTTSVWQSPGSMPLRIQSTLWGFGHMSASYVIASPGGYVLRIIGQASQANQLTVYGTPSSWLTAAWEDIAGPNG